MPAPSGSTHLRRGARGDVWYLRYRLPDGRQVKKRLGPAWTDRGRPPRGFYTRRIAEAALREALVDAQRGELLAQQATGATFADACTEWLRYVEHDRERRRSTVADYRNAVRSTLLPHFGPETPLEQVTVDAVDAFRATLLREGQLSNRTVAKLLVMLHGIFRRAQRLYGLRTNPAAGVDRPPVRRSGDFRVLDPDEVAALVDALGGEQDGAIVTTAAFSGIRLGELRALRWMDVDFSKRVLHIRRSFTRRELGATKSGKVRSVPMVDQVVRALDGLSRRENFVGSRDLVFVNEVGGVIDDSRLRRRFARALERVGLEPLRFHDLRHTFGTLAVRVFPLSDVKAYMGHADIQTTMIYVHHVPQHDAADRLSRALDTASLGLPVPSVRSET